MNMICRPLLSIVSLLLAALHASSAENVAPLNALGKLPVRELTVFKDGHVFVAHQGAMPVDGDGNVAMDYLPTPVIGTFWPFSATKGAQLAGVTASQRRVMVERTALTIRELLEANIGADAFITEVNGTHYRATILGFPTRSSEELATTTPNTAERLPEKSSLILLKTDEGTRALPVERVQDIAFRSEPKPRLANEEFRNLLMLQLDWNGRKPDPKAEVGLFYLQKGIRWIPSYKVAIDGKGNAAITLQATLLNELTDFEDVTVNLVIGVPTFAFKETIDPISLQQSAAQLSQYFNNNNLDNRSVLAGNFSNAMMTQSRVGDYRQNSEASAAPGANEPDNDRNEDLYIFTIKKLSLKKGQRIVVPVVDFTIPYEDVFKAELSFAPPSELHANLNNAQQLEMARLLNAPKLMHHLRLNNKSKYPLTTAPALIVKGQTVLAQGMMTYTAPGAHSDLAVTAAVDLSLRKTETEVNRIANAERLDGTSWSRVEMKGGITIVNHRRDTVKVEITRHLLSAAATADHNGTVRKASVFDDAEARGSSSYPYWWSWYSWPAWWSRFNGMAQITWEVQVEPGKAIDLGYEWHYFWR